MRPIHVKFLIELLLFIAASSNFGSGDLKLGCLPGECDGCLNRGFSELKRTFTVPMEINYVRSKQVNFPCMCVFSRDLTHILKLDAAHSTECLKC